MNVILFGSYYDYTSLSTFNRNELSWSIGFSIKEILNGLNNNDIASNTLWMCNYSYVLSNSFNILINDGNNNSRNALSNELFDVMIVTWIFNLRLTISNSMKYQLIDLLQRLVQIMSVLSESHKIKYNLKELLQNTTNKIDNKYTNKELGFVMNKLKALSTKLI